jgi:hypothetical protein
MTATRLVFTGPDRYCPHCGRWLVRVHPDGRFTLAGNAAIEATVSEVDFRLPPDEVESVVVEAICLRPLCRLRRSVRR